METNSNPQAIDSGLVVGIKCVEPRMARQREACRDRDSYAIFQDDNLEIRLENAKGIRLFIVVNPNAAVLDGCIATRSEDPADFYTVRNIAEKRAADRWFVEALLEAKPIEDDGAQRKRPLGRKHLPPADGRQCTRALHVLPQRYKIQGLKGHGETHDAALTCT